MNKLCIFAGTIIGGYGFGYFATLAGLGFGWVFASSGVGRIVGVWAGWKVAQRYQ